MPKISPSGRVLYSGRIDQQLGIKNIARVPTVADSEPITPQPTQPQQLTPEQKQQQLDIKRQNAERQKQISEWKQAETLAFRIQSGIGKRYDPKSAVGRKVNKILDANQLPQEVVDFQLKKLQQQHDQQTYIDPTTNLGYSILPGKREEFISSLQKPTQNILNFIKDKPKQSVVPQQDTSPLPIMMGGGDLGRTQSGRSSLVSGLDYFAKEYKKAETKLSTEIQDYWQNIGQEIITGAERTGYEFKDEKTRQKVEDISKGKFTYDTELQRDIIEQPISTTLKLGAGGLIAPKTSLVLLGSSESKKDFQESDYFAMRTLGELFPSGSTEIALTSGLIGGYKFLPPVLKLGASGVIGATGTIGSLDSTATTEERVASGVIGGLGIAGAGAEVYPYLRGLGGRLSPKFSPTKTAPEGTFQYVEVAGEKGQFDIRFIPSREAGAKGKGSAFETGAYDFSPSYQKKYIEKEGTVVSSARDFFGFFKKKVDIKTDADPLGFYGTPWDIKTGSAQTRLSRLGIKNWGDLFKIPKVGTKFSFKYEKPQILFFEGAKVTKKGGGGTFKAIGNPSGELEVTATGRIFSGGKKSVTVIKGQKVDIFSAKLDSSKASGESITSQLNKIGFRSSKYDSTFVSRSGTISSGLGGLFMRRTKPSRTSKRIMLPSSSIKPSSFSSDISKMFSSRTYPTPTSRRTPSLSKIPSPSSIFSPSGIYAPSSYFDRRRTDKRRKTTSSSKTIPPLIIPRRPELPEKKKETSYLPRVLHRGKWFNISKSTMDYNSALSRGSEGADFTTSRRFKVVQQKGKPQITGYGDWTKRQHKFRPYKIKKGRKVALPNSYIEKRRYAIDTKSEARGLNIAKYSKQRGWLFSPVKKKKITKKTKSRRKKK